MSKFISTMACIDSMVAELKASSDLAAIVTSAFPGKTLSYWIGYDPQNMPLVSLAPYLVLMPGQFGRDAMRTQQTHAIQIALIIDQGSSTSSGGITRFSGLETSERLADAIDRALTVWIERNFRDGYTKQLFNSSMALPEVKTVWGYEFVDQI